MTFRGLLRGQSVEVVHRSFATDDYGQRIESATQEVTYPAYLEQTSEQEVTGGAEAAISDWLIVLPPEATGIRPLDRIQSEGRVFEVVGSPRLVRRPATGELHHVEARLRFIEWQTGSP
ncbi:MAG TPA: hypothetical protein VM840_13630 [Actinomycetota bacterium]|nr:hypothetical protein [Actinomycetota bacterium]